MYFRSLESFQGFSQNSKDNSANGSNSVLKSVIKDATLGRRDGYKRATGTGRLKQKIGGEGPVDGDCLGLDSGKDSKVRLRRNNDVD